MSGGHEFKDLFSAQAADYSRFRPRYPDALYSYLAGLSKTHDLAWDCGTGNGQAACALSPHFARIVASDPSEKQLAQAERRPNVEFRIATAEGGAGFVDKTVDLVCVAQALHWFDLGRFYREVRRVTKVDGHLAVWTYGLAKITPTVNALVDNYCFGIIAKYWEPERKLVDEGYRHIPFPFVEIDTPPFTMELTWSLAHLAGYLGTWSATQAAIRDTGKNPVDELMPALEKAWGNPDEEKHVSWDINLRVGRV